PSRRRENPPASAIVPRERPGSSRGSGAQPLPAARPAGIEHLLAALGGHPGAETVTALAHQLARLIGPLHDIFSPCPGGAPLGRLTMRQTPQIRAKITGFSGSAPLKR